MKADSRFNKRAAPEVLSNSTTVDFNQYLDKECPIRMTVYAVGNEGAWHLSMNPLEAHRLIHQMNDALMKWAYAQIKRSQGDSK